MIPIPAANKIIDGITQINEGLTELARWVEEQAFDGIEDEYALAGERPHAPVDVPETKPPTSAAEPETSEPVVTLVEVRTALSALSQAGKAEQVRSLDVLDVNAQGRLRYVQLLRCAAEALLLGNGRKGHQLVQVHPAQLGRPSLRH